MVQVCSTTEKMLSLGVTQHTASWKNRYSQHMQFDMVKSVRPRLALLESKLKEWRNQKIIENYEMKCSKDSDVAKRKKNTVSLAKMREKADETRDI